MVEPIEPKYFHLFEQWKWEKEEGTATEIGFDNTKFHNDDYPFMKGNSNEMVRHPLKQLLHHIIVDIAPIYEEADKCEQRMYQGLVLLPSKTKIISEIVQFMRKKTKQFKEKKCGSWVEVEKYENRLRKFISNKFIKQREVNEGLELKFETSVNPSDARKTLTLISWDTSNQACRNRLLLGYTTPEMYKKELSVPLLIYSSVRSKNIFPVPGHRYGIAPRICQKLISLTQLLDGEYCENIGGKKYSRNVSGNSVKCFGISPCPNLLRELCNAISSISKTREGYYTPVNESFEIFQFHRGSAVNFFAENPVQKRADKGTQTVYVSLNSDFEGGSMEVCLKECNGSNVRWRTMKSFPFLQTGTVLLLPSGLSFYAKVTEIKSEYVHILRASFIDVATQNHSIDIEREEIASCNFKGYPTDVAPISNTTMSSLSLPRKSPVDSSNSSRSDNHDFSSNARNATSSQDSLILNRKGIEELMSNDFTSLSGINTISSYSVYSWRSNMLPMSDVSGNSNAVPLNLQSNMTSFNSGNKIISSTIDTNIELSMNVDEEDENITMQLYHLMLAEEEEMNKKATTGLRDSTSNNADYDDYGDGALVDNWTLNSSILDSIPSSTSSASEKLTAMALDFHRHSS